jgi:nucleoside-diphosphate-sugar epimerase
MTTFIAGGTGFIGRRLVPLLAQQGEEVVCMDINLQAADFGHLGNRVKVVRGDVGQFDDVMAAMTSAKPKRAINLAYWLGSAHPPRVASS